MQRPVVVPRSPPPAVTSRRTLMGLIGSGMCLSDVTCPQPPAEHPISRITRTAVLLSLVRAPALPPRHAYFGSQSHTPYDRCLRFGPRVAATPARLAPVPPAQLWTDQTCTGKLISASPIAPRTTLFGRGFTALLVCYSFESCFHGRRFISLHRWPYPPLHGGHVAFEQFNAR